MNIVGESLKAQRALMNALPESIAHGHTPPSGILLLSGEWYPLIPSVKIYSQFGVKPKTQYEIDTEEAMKELDAIAPGWKE